MIVLLESMKKSCKAQMKLSFGMIFAILLIVFFMGFAFYAIQKFLGMQRTLSVGSFSKDLQDDVNRLWRSSQKAQENKEYALPDKIEKACFLDSSSAIKGRDWEIGDDLKRLFGGEDNLYFYPVGSAEGLDSLTIDHLDLDEMTSRHNPYCINNSGGKVRITIKKDFNNPLVILE